jgi:hypothetical protein
VAGTHTTQILIPFGTYPSGSPVRHPYSAGPDGSGDCESKSGQHQSSRWGNSKSLTTMRTTVHPVRIHSVGGAHRCSRRAGVVRIGWGRCGGVEQLRAAHSSLTRAEVKEKRGRRAPGGCTAPSPASTPARCRPLHRVGSTQWSGCRARCPPPRCAPPHRAPGIGSTQWAPRWAPLGGRVRHRHHNQASPNPKQTSSSGYRGQRGVVFRRGLAHGI